jgi:hypothetical protein
MQHLRAYLKLLECYYRYNIIDVNVDIPSYVHSITPNTNFFIVFIQLWVERLSRKKHASLLGPFVSYKDKYVL